VIGIIIPAHNEARCIGPCVLSVIQAARHPALRVCARIATMALPIVTMQLSKYGLRPGSSRHLYRSQRSSTTTVSTFHYLF
jgi:hypothetical protein